MDLPQKTEKCLTVTKQNAYIPSKLENLQSESNVPHDLGICVEKPKFPQYAVSQKRLESFEKWPDYIPVNKKDLVEAGLVYTGIGDSVRCYHCGGGLRNWERGDVPMVEHAKWYPNCPHVLLVKGPQYVAKISRGEQLDTDATHTQVDVKEEIKKADVMESSAARSCLENGIDEGTLKQAINIFIAKNGHTNFKGVDLAQICFDMEEDPSIVQQYTYVDSKVVGSQMNDYTDGTVKAEISDDECLDELKEENTRLRESQMCKICLDNLADVIFLPCGHMVSCPQCAPAMSKCPICRKPVNGQFKAFFSVLAQQSQ